MCAVTGVALNLGIDAVAGDGSSVGYPARYGFELEDGIYLLAPITWLGWLQPFFVIAGAGAAAYLVWTCYRLAALRQAKSNGKTASQQNVN